MRDYRCAPRTLLVTFFTLLAPLGWAQPPSTVLTLQEAMGSNTERDHDVVVAAVELESAERDAARVAADPFALRLPRLQAEGALATARDALVAAKRRAQAQTQNAFYEALEADDALRLAVRALALAQTTLEATEIRFEAGAVMALDIERARNGLRAAERSLAAAQTRRTLAYSDLAGRLGVDPQTLSLREPTDDAPIPTLDAALARLRDNTEVRRAEQAVLEARVSLEGVDNAFSARVEVESAEAAYSSAQDRLEELRRSLALSVSAEHMAVLALHDALRAAEQSYATEKEALEVQRARFEAGSVSRLELAQTALDTATSATEVRAARYALGRAVLALEGALQGEGVAVPSSSNPPRSALLGSVLSQQAPVHRAPLGKLIEPHAEREVDRRAPGERRPLEHPKPS